MRSHTYSNLFSSWKEHSYLIFTLRWRRLKAQMIEKRSKLGESQTLQQFSRDVDEIEAWISEKLQTASDESYKDPTNIQVRGSWDTCSEVPLLLSRAVKWDSLREYVCKAMCSMVKLKKHPLGR